MTRSSSPVRGVVLGLGAVAVLPVVALVAVWQADLDEPWSVVIVAVVAVVAIAIGLLWVRHLIDGARSQTEQRSGERFAAMIEHSTDAVVFAGPDRAMTSVSPRLGAMLGLEAGSWRGRDLAEIVLEAERPSVRERFDEAVTGGPGTTVQFDASLDHRDGQQRQAVVTVANVGGPSADESMVITVRDVTEQRNLERQLSHRAFHDELTGLANRALFLDRLDHALRVARHAVDPVVVLFVDLDDFKRVNDDRGHTVGDTVLHTIAERIVGAAGSGDTVARLGGDEFALLLEDRGGVDRALDVAERLLEALRLPLDGGSDDFVVMASIGVAVAAPGMSTTGLLRDADVAMYEAKRAGKGQIRIFDPAMRLMATKHLEYRGDLADAIARNEMRLVFMPYVDLSTGQVVGAEALIRWTHPDHGDIPASEFMGVAERSGLIVPIGEWAMGQALVLASEWRPGLLLSMNVSAVQIGQPDFAERLIDLARLHRIDPSAVVFELAESVLADEDAGATVRTLRTLGFRFAIDDFGTGQTSIASLQRYPIDLIKIDRSAVAALGVDTDGNGSGPPLADTIVHTAAALGLVTVAEGIETADQLHRLQQLGCDLGQGFLLSQPIEADDLARRFGRPSSRGRVRSSA